MRHELFGSLDELLAPETLSRLTGCTISSVRRVPFIGGHAASGSGLFGVETNGEDGTRFVVKQTSWERDWIMRVTADVDCREVQTWTSGLLDRLPPEIDHPVLACARDGAGWAILMRDVSDTLLPPWGLDSPIEAKDHVCVLDALAALHARFWDGRWQDIPGLSFCETAALYSSMSPESGRREFDHHNGFPRIVVEGWDIFWSLVPSRVADLIRPLANDPGPLCAALMRYPRTLIHGDPRPANLGVVLTSAPRALLLDWQIVSVAAPGVDLAWYLEIAGIQLTMSRETIIEWYRNALARRLGERFDDRWWQPQLALSLLGQMVRTGWLRAWRADRDESAEVRALARVQLDWFCERALEAERWLA